MQGYSPLIYNTRECFFSKLQLNNIHVNLELYFLLSVLLILVCGVRILVQFMSIMQMLFPTAAVCYMLKASLPKPITQ